jgi:hypothetical protein
MGPRRNNAEQYEHGQNDQNRDHVLSSTVDGSNFDKGNATVAA